jgi:hypothetical protein
MLPKWLTLALLLALTMTACGTASVPTGAPATQSEATIAPETEVATTAPTGFTAPTATCDELNTVLLQTTGIQAAVTVEPFEDEYAQAAPAGEACAIHVSGTTASVGMVAGDVYDMMAPVITGLGWVPANNYAAGGVMSLSEGYWKGNQLAIVSAHWQPTEEANCPDNQHIGDCQFAPEHQSFAYSIVIAELPPGVNPPSE